MNCVVIFVDVKLKKNRFPRIRALSGMQLGDFLYRCEGLVATLEVTQGQILSQSPTDVTRFWWHLYGS